VNPHQDSLFEEEEPYLEYGTGVEREETASDEEIIEPFDTSLIRVETKPSTIDLLLQRIKFNEIDLAPDFQRKAGIWKESAQSRLIESLLIRVPLPAFYMDATNEERWLVVDGLQRLTALKRFCLDKSLSLTGLEFLSQHHKKTYDDLPRNFQRRILETQVTVYLIEQGTPPEVKFNIFKRINTGGLPLSSQEIRHALNHGQVRDYLARLADSVEFKVATNYSIRDERMADRECVLRFLAFTLTPYTQYKSKDLDSFLNDSMHHLNKMPPDTLKQLEDRFSRSMNAARDIFGKKAFRKPTKGVHAPINKALFEAWSVNLSRLSDEEIELLKERSGDLYARFAKLMDDWEFNKSVSISTGNVKTIRNRFSGVAEIIKETLL
jgi:uncharacterized protein with ParB-like and HNH nuclease domain